MNISAAAWIAIGAACAATAALGLSAYLFLQLRRVRASQLVLLGGGKDDLVDFAVSLRGASTTCTAPWTRSPRRFPASTAGSTDP